MAKQRKKMTLGARVAALYGENGERIQGARVSYVPAKTPKAIVANDPVGMNELISLTALMTYVARMSGQDELIVAQQFADKFGVSNVKRLPVNRFEEALRYLVDQVSTVKKTSKTIN